MDARFSSIFKYLTALIGPAAAAFFWPAASLAALKLPPTNLTYPQQVEHALSRLTFGPTTALRNELLAKPEALADWIETQLHPEKIPENPALEMELGALPALKLSAAELLEKYPQPKKLIGEEQIKAVQSGAVSRRELIKTLKKEGKINTENLPAEMIRELSEEKVLRAVESNRQLEEVLADFWFNHFNVFAQKGLVKWYLIPYERDVIRPHLFGKFRDLLLATAKSPAMLFYLDNWQNVKNGFTPPKRSALAKAAKKLPRGINENYARELMELHTLGVDGGYDQKDVIAVARALTGWSIDKPRVNPTFRFRPRTHDEDEKTVLGLKIKAGGVEDGYAVINLLATHPSTAKFIATKLCRHFVADNPPASCVKNVASRFLATDGDLRQTYRALFTDPSFWAPAAYKAKIKRPFEFVASTFRALGLGANADNRLPGLISRLGEPLYLCQPPTGYKDEAKAWVSSGALVNRLNLSLMLLNRKLDWIRRPEELNNFVEGSTRTEKPEDAITSAYRRLSLDPLASSTEKVIESALGAGKKMPDGELRPLRNRQLLGMLLGTPEFQRK